MNQEQDANSRPLGLVEKAVLWLFIDAIAGVVILVAAEYIYPILSYETLTALAGIMIFPAIAWKTSIRVKQPNIWFYPLSRVLLFIVYVVILFYICEFNPGSGILGPPKFDEYFPWLFRNFLIYSIPALIAGIAYARMIKKRAGREEDGDKTT